MKSLMIFVDPKRDFTEEHKVLAKIQVDNSLDLGWNPDDIVVVTNFPWEYRGVYSLIVPGHLYFPSWPRATKLPVINHLIERGYITDQFWFHDFDAFQLEPMEEIKSDFAATIHTSEQRGDTRWCAGSFFFNRMAEESFLTIEDKMWTDNIDEEMALADLWNDGTVNPDPLDVRWNLGMYDLAANMRKATRPLMVAHFHPMKPRHMNLFRGIVPDRLKDIFRRHGYSHA